jgi:hypothetical protein
LKTKRNKLLITKKIPITKNPIGEAKNELISLINMAFIISANLQSYNFINAPCFGFSIEQWLCFGPNLLK